MRTLFVAVLALVLAPSIAVAGGGSKPNGTVTVKNNGSNTLAVVVDPSAAVLASLQGGTLDAQTFLKARGQFVGPGGTATFGGLRAGSHTVAGAYLSGTSAGSTVGTLDSVTLTVNKGKTVKVVATGSTATQATLTVP
jgi:hypothetical protein